MKIILMILLCLSLSSPSYAELKETSLPEAVSNSHIIVVGMIKQIERSDTNNIAHCKGIIEVREVLKGAPTNSITLCWEFGFNGHEEEDQIDHTFRKNTTLIWLLRCRENGTFITYNHPVHVQPIQRLEEIKQILKKGPNQSSEATPKPGAPQ